MSREFPRHMKNCTINVSTSDATADEMPPLGKASSTGLITKTLG